MLKYIKKINDYFLYTYKIQTFFSVGCGGSKNQYDMVKINLNRIPQDRRTEVIKELNELLPGVDYYKTEGIISALDLKNSLFLEKIETKRIKKKLDQPNLFKRAGKKCLLPVFFDTETEEILEEGVKEILEKKDISEKENHKLRKSSCVMPGIIGYKRKGEKTKLVYKGKNMFEEFIEDLKKLDKNYHVVLIGHNVQYDIEALVPVLHHHGIHVYTKLLKDNRFFSGFTTGKIYLSFHDSLRFKKMSLEKATGTEKLEVPYGLSEVKVGKDEISYYSTKFKKYQTFSRKKLEEYTALDVEGVEQIISEQIETIEYLFNELLQEGVEIESLLHKSEAGLSESYTRKYIDQKKERNWYMNTFRFPISEEEYSIQRDSIIAGVTGFNKDQNSFIPSKNKSIFKYDVISMYPKIIQEGIPGGEFLDSKPEGDYVKGGLLEKLTHEIPVAKPEFRFMSTNVFKNIGFYSSTQNKFYMCDALYQVCKKIYPDFTNMTRVLKNTYQKKFKEIGQAQEALTAEKMRIDMLLKINPDKMLKLKRQAIKIVLNSIYGKLMERTWQQSKYYFDGELVTLANEVTEKQNNLSGIYIAQTGRAQLFTFLMRTTENSQITPIYWDTDSITLEAPKHRKGEKKIFGELKKEIGGGGFEGEFSEAHLFGVKKKYFLEPIENDFSALDKAGAFSGIKNLPTTLKNLYINDREKYKALKSEIIGKNPLFLGVKQTPILTTKYKQKILYDIDVSLLGDIKKTLPITNRLLISSNNFEILNG